VGARFGVEAYLVSGGWAGLLPAGADDGAGSVSGAYPCSWWVTVVRFDEEGVEDVPDAVE
jgi:hypothetical protein